MVCANRGSRPMRAPLWVLLGALWAASAHAQVFSPGELSKNHKHIDGIAQCTKCHGEGNKNDNSKCLECHGIGSSTLDDKCLACHEEIGWLRGASRGLHGIEAGKLFE